MRMPLLLSFFFLISFPRCTPSSSETSLLEKPSKDSLISIVTKDTIKELPVIEEPIIIPIDYDTNQWSELIRLDSSLQIDIKYATTENFVEEKMYECSRCFLRPEVAQAVVKAHQYLQTKSYGLKMLDCFRPHPVQWKLWKKVPDPRYVTDPKKGSMHNRGAAVDLTLTDLQGKPLEMGTPFDYFGQEAYHTFTALPDSIMEKRLLLKKTMEKFGFRAIRTEWWHYSFQEKAYPLSDMLWKCYE